MPHALTLKKIDGKPGQVYYPLQVKEIAQPTPGPNEIVVKVNAVALNHRDLFIRQHLYPGISFDNPLLADGHGTVTALGSGASKDLLGKSVLFNPSRGWASAPEGPEDASFSVAGGSKLTPFGTAQDYVAVPESEVELAPEHLTPAEGAALPLVGVTGWRALVTKTGNARPGRNIFVTGIGGGVALQVLQFGVALGCNVYVSSGDDAKLDRARSMGAAGGVNYKTDPQWEKTLQKALPADRPYLDAVVDGAGGDIVGRAVKLLKPGGVISQYGMTVSPKMDWLMSANLKNLELRGSTMGSRAEFAEMVRFVRDKEIRPVVSRSVQGLDNLDGIDELFQEMKDGKQFGKLVIVVDPAASGSSKL